MKGILHLISIMKKYNYTFIIILFIFFTNKGIAQNQRKIDSLKKELRLVHPDSITTNILKNLSWYYATTRSKLDSAKFYADSLKSFSLKTNNEGGIAISYFYYGLIERFKGNHYQGLKHLDNYLEYSKDSMNVAAGLFQMGVIHNAIGNYDECLKIYFRILSIYEENEMKKSIATTLHSIGHIQRKMDKYQEAIESYQKSIILKEKLKDTIGLAMSLASIGNTHREMGNFNLAKHNLLKAHELAKAKRTPYLIASISENLGILYGKTDDYSKSLKYHLDAFKTRVGLPSKKELAQSLNKIGLSYLKLNEFEKSHDYLTRSLLIAKKIDANPIILVNYETFVELHSETKNFRKAYEFQNKFVALKDSIFNIDKTKQLFELETKYEVQQKNKEIELLTKENELQEAKSDKETTFRKALVAGLLLLIIIASLIFYTMRQRLRNQKILVEKNEEIKRSQYREQLQILEMKALRAQMNPHFLFNSLNSINTMIISDENDNASKYLSKFSKLVRLMLENSEQPRVSLKDEISMLESYVQLEALRFNNKIEYKIEVDELIDQDSTYIPSMVLQPFVENAIWHGLLHKDTKGMLTITIKEDSDNLYCSIIDNGIGRDKSLTLQKEGGLKKKSMGIKITTDRLKLLTRQKINEMIAIIDLKDDNNNALGTQVNIQIPLS